MNIDTFKNLQIYKINQNDDKRINNIYVAHNCSIIGKNSYYPNCLIHSNDKIYNPYDEKIMSLNKECFYDDLYHENIQMVDKKSTDSVYFFIYNFDNYYHFIYDTLPYLINFLDLKKEILDLKLLINYPNKNNKFYQFNIDILDMLQLEYEIVDQDTLYENMYISNSLTHGGFSNDPPHSIIYDFFNNLKNNIMLKHDFPKKIYISRRTWTKQNNDNIGTNYTTRRKMMNEDFIVDYLSKKGYVEIFAEDYPMSDKIMLFSQATHIVGAIGGGLCNLLFSNKNTKVLCIVSPDFVNINYRFKYSMDHTNIKYFNDCHIDKPSKISLYTRVTITDPNSEYYNKIGEVIKYDEKNKDNYLVNISNNDVTGFNNEFIYNTQYFTFEQLKPLDNGLNSPYYVDKDVFMTMCENY